MKTVCIIQARRGSSRLPDKILKPIAGKTILEHVIERVLHIEGIDTVVCATVANRDNETVLTVAESAGAASFAGSEHDVLARYYKAATKHKADIVIRITADCPLIDPYICTEAVSLVKTGKADYGAVSGAWIHGMDCEAFTFNWLEKAYTNATSQEDREHVTLWLKRQPNIKKGMVEPPITLPRNQNRWVVDYPEDYEFMVQLAAAAPNGTLPIRWQDTLGLIEKKPYLREINKHRIIEWAQANAEIIQKAQEK